MKKILILLTIFGLMSCNLDDSFKGFIQDNDEKSEIIVKLADSYLAGNFDMARDYFTPDGKHFFNNLEFDVDGIIDGYKSSIENKIAGASALFCFLLLTSVFSYI